MTPQDLGVEIEEKLVTLKVEDPPTRKGGIKVGSVDELVANLEKEGFLK